MRGTVTLRAEGAHLYNELMMDAVNRYGLVSLNVEESATVQELSDKCLQLVG